MELAHPVLSSFQGFYQLQQTSLSPPAPAPIAERSRGWEILSLPQIPAILPAGFGHAQSTGWLQAGKKERCTPALQSSLERRDPLATRQRQVPHCCTGTWFLKAVTSMTCFGYICSMGRNCGLVLRRMSPFNWCISAPCCWLLVSSLEL